VTPANPAEICLPLGLLDTLSCNLQQKDTRKTWKGGAGGYQALMVLLPVS